jgi:proteasome lid subunit RPN8/RPN11
MNIDLREQTTKQITMAAEQAYPHECCGILLGRNENGRVVIVNSREAANQTAKEKSARHFEIDPLFLYQVEREIEGSNLEIVGFYHSHPDCKAVPSQQDLECMIPGLIYAILSVTKEGVVDIQFFPETAFAIE